VSEGSDHHDVYEAARILGLSPARVRQMLRSGELTGERVEGHAKGIPGPWKVRADSVRALRASQEQTERGERRETGEEAAETVALGETLVGEGAAGNPSRRDTGGTPSEAAELLSESVRGLMEKLEALKRELEQLEGRLEFSEIQEFALQESLRRERERAASEKERAERESERADTLQAKLDAWRRDQRGGEQRSPWQRLFGG
jgi:hypothetical protein